MRELGKIFYFSAAHKLPSHKGLCRRLHGHTYKLEVRVAGEPIGDPEREKDSDGGDPPIS
jgi:6-pyruvoyltetrahydropterin/6-carboxytetrahydropterin synthase